MAHLTRFERVASTFGGWRSIQLELSRVALACHFPHSFSSYPKVGKAYQPVRISGTTSHNRRKAEEKTEEIKREKNYYRAL